MITAPLHNIKMILRTFFILSVAATVTGFLSACVILFSVISPNENRVHRVAQIWADILIKLLDAEITVLGQENIPSTCSVIFMANHQGMFDILALYRAVPSQFRWIIKKELFSIPLFGKALENAGYLKIDRYNRENAIRDVEAASQKIRNGSSIMTFPEGTRSLNGEIGSFKKGMFHLALQTGSPIVPISIVGAFQILNRLTTGLGEGKKAVVIIGNPIETKEYCLDGKDELLDRVRQIIIANCDKASQMLL